MNLITGSTALKYWFPDFPREPKDLDIISSEKINENTKDIEYHWLDGFQYILDRNTFSICVYPNFLYTIKVSHAAWDIYWDKTMFDIKFLQEKGFKLDNELYNILYKHWEIIHSKKKIKVKGYSEDFFNNNVTRKMNHDEVHQLVKFYNKGPIHEVIRKDKKDVACNKELWDTLSNDDKIKCCLEEIYVFALERYTNFPPKTAFNKALKHLITKSTKGWFNLFLIENFSELIYYDKSKYFIYYNKYKEMINE